MPTNGNSDEITVQKQPPVDHQENPANETLSSRYAAATPLLLLYCARGGRAAILFPHFCPLKSAILFFNSRLLDGAILFFCVCRGLNLWFGKCIVFVLIIIFIQKLLH
jgi:hypothetical protein